MSCRRGGQPLPVIYHHSVNIRFDHLYHYSVTKYNTCIYEACDFFMLAKKILATTAPGTVSIMFNKYSISVNSVFFNNLVHDLRWISLGALAPIRVVL